MKTKILITGATGNTGFPLAQNLAKLKVPFRALVHTESKEHLLDKLATEVVVGDYNDPAPIECALEGIEKVYLASPASPDMYRFQTSFVSIAQKKGVKHIMKLSALGASLKSRVGLLRVHAEIEAYIRLSGISWTFLHPHFFMENLLTHAPSVLNEGAVYSPLGGTRISTISVQDIAAFAATLLKSGRSSGKTHILTGPEAVTYDDIAAALGKVIGRPVRYVPIPFEQARQGMIQSGISDWFADDFIKLMKTWTEGEGEIVTSTVENVLKRKPVSIREFFRKHRDAFAVKRDKAA